MSRRRKGWKALSVLRSLLGVALAPTAVAAVFTAAAALGGLSSRLPGTVYFLSAFAGYSLLHALRFLTLYRFYVFAHELTHALAAWALGGKVFALAVGKQSGHVDLSRTNAFIALAPYWVPFYSLLAVAAYRMVLWWGSPPYARETFLALMGATLAFHFAHTIEALWTTHQSDLDEAGFPLSISSIVLLNGLLLLAAVKCLFPHAVSFADGLRQMGAITALFWGGAAGLLHKGGTWAVSAVR
ncbi:MAG: hypothetical protein ABIJ96_04665 [Elusimicrobiota bacterium]